MNDEEILLLYKSTYERLGRRPWYEVKLAFAREMELAGKRAAYEDAVNIADQYLTIETVSTEIRDAIRARAAEVCK